MPNEENQVTTVADVEAALLSLDEGYVAKLLSFGTGFPWSRMDALLVPALEDIGRRWEQGELALSQIYLAGRTCERVMDGLFSAGGGQAKREAPRMAVAVLEDYHLLGKRIVYAILRSAGYEPADYGRVTVERCVERVKAEDTRLLFVSTLMLPSALRVGALCAALRDAGSACRVVVGGAPFRFDRELWKEVGAWGMGVSASDALGFVDAAREEARA